MFEKSKTVFTTLFRQNGVFVLLGIVSLLVLFVIFVALFSKTGTDENNPNSPTPTSVPEGQGTSQEQKIAPSQKTIIEKTTQQEIEKLSSIENKSVLPNGEIRYTFPSYFKSRKNEVIVKDNQAIFERILIPISRQDPAYVTISEYKNKYGQPQEVIRGSHYYGNLIETFIYADKGFTLIGNSFTDEVFEVQTFTPTSVDNYKRLYGQDINEDAAAGHM